jgi:hypothetical protein
MRWRWCAVIERSDGQCATNGLKAVSSQDLTALETTMHHSCSQSAPFTPHKQHTKLNAQRHLPLGCQDLLRKCMNLLVVVVILLEAILTAKVRGMHPQLDALGARQALFYDVCTPRGCTSSGGINLILLQVRHGRDRCLWSCTLRGNVVAVRDHDGSPPACPSTVYP